MTDITPIDTARQNSKLATTPRESFENEAQWKAAEAWAKEQRDYEMVVNAFRGWILQRRNTTRLIEPHIIHGGHGPQHRGNDMDTSVVLADFGFTKLQWSRRKKELEIDLIQVDSYLDECIEKSTQPTLYGMLKAFASNKSAHGASQRDPWYEVEQRLNELYIVYYDGNKREHETKLAVERLMRAYNTWID